MRSPYSVCDVRRPTSIPGPRWLVRCIRIASVSRSAGSGSVSSNRSTSHSCSQKQSENRRCLLHYPNTTGHGVWPGSSANDQTRSGRRRANLPACSSPRPGCCRHDKLVNPTKSTCAGKIGNNPRELFQTETWEDCSRRFVTPPSRVRRASIRSVMMSARPLSLSR